MDYVLELLVLLALAVLALVWLFRRGGGRPGRARRSVCKHEWGIAESHTGWDQKCIKCGEWKSGYGKTWW